MPVAIANNLQQQLQYRIDTKTKPPGALGMLEEIALKVGLIQGSANPHIRSPHIVVFAGDHGIAATGLVTAYPQEVTAQMVLNFLGGGAAINVFCRQHDLVLKVVDAGVNADWNDAVIDDHFIHAKMAYGTADFLKEPAMSESLALASIEKGKEIVRNIHATGCNCIGFGEMGIGNTSSASLIMSAVTGFAMEECAGYGTGLTDDQFATKLDTLKTVFRKHMPAIVSSPGAITVLRHFGGFEIAMIAGACLEAATLKMVIVIDGFITTAALLIAQMINSSVPGYCIFAHTSGERGHQKMLDYLHARPLLNLSLRLGEGTGAALAIPLILSSVNFLNEMASFESAGISNKE